MIAVKFIKELSKVSNVAMELTFKLKIFDDYLLIVGLSDNGNVRDYLLILF
jgi:hypothetical protein